jgi:hypothetical protein
LSESAAEDTSRLPDLSETTLDRIARLCDPAGENLDLDDVSDRPVLRQALLRLQREAAQPGELFAGFNSHLP